MATNNAVNVPLSGTTGTVSFAGSTSATFTTPIIGVATATSINFSPSTTGVAGTITNNNAATGVVGEFLTNTGTAVSISNGTPLTIAQVTLTAGDWEIYGYLQTNPAGSTTTSLFLGGISGTTNVDGSANFIIFTPYLAGIQGACAAPTVYTGTAGATFYLVVQCSFAVSTMTVTGTINARRTK